MAKWYRLRLRTGEILQVEAGAVVITVRGNGSVQMERADGAELPNWRKPPLHVLVPAEREGVLRGEPEE